MIAVEKDGKAARVYSTTPRAKRMLELMNQGKSVEEAAQIVVSEEAPQDRSWRTKDEQ